MVEERDSKVSVEVRDEFLIVSFVGWVYAHLCKVVIGHFGSCFGFLGEYRCFLQYYPYPSTTDNN